MSLLTRRLELAHQLELVNTALAELEDSIRGAFDPDEHVPGTRVEDVLDRNGRPVLTDVLVARANALAALAALMRA